MDDDDNTAAFTFVGATDGTREENIGNAYRRME